MSAYLPLGLGLYVGFGVIEIGLVLLLGNFCPLSIVGLYEFVTYFWDLLKQITNVIAFQVELKKNKVKYKCGLNILLQLMCGKKCLN